jgi:hypothetical protein
MYQAVLEGNVSTARDILTQSPEVLRPSATIDSWLYLAAGNDDLAMMEMLVGAGLDVNVEQVSGHNPLSKAAMSGSVRAAKWLLDRGGKLIPATPLSGGALIGAVNSGSVELVRLLLDHGADVNAAHGSPPQNALSHAMFYGHTAIADLLRAHGATLPQEPVNQPSDREEIIAHVERHLGSVAPAVGTSIVPGEVDLLIHVVPPDADHPYQTLFTTGMSSRAMTVPVGGEDYKYPELLIYLPADWPVTKERLQGPDHHWPIEWLRKIAGYPLLQGTWLRGDYTVISNEEPPRPLALHVRFTSFLLLTNTTPLNMFRLASGKLIRFYTLFPMYTEERDLVLAQGPRPLLERFHQQGIDLTVDVQRPNVAAQVS